MGFKENFSEPLTDYKFGNWNNRSVFLPSLTPSAAQDEAGPVAVRLREKTKAGDIDSVKMLLQSGVSPNLHIDHKKRTALHYATMASNVPMVQLLLRFFADPHKTDVSLDGPNAEVSGWCPLDIAEKDANLPIMALFSVKVDANAVVGRPPEGVAGRLHLGVQPPTTSLRSRFFGGPLRIELRSREAGFLQRGDADAPLEMRCATVSSFYSAPSPRPESRGNRESAFF